MKRKGKQTLTPKLRFPEFRDEGEWESFLLEELEDLGWLELGRGNVISAKDMNGVPGTYPVYSSSVKNNGYMGSYGRFMFDEELISWSVDGGGDFFYRPKHKFSVTNVSGYMRLKTDRLAYRFIANQLQFLHASYTFDYQLKAHPSVIRKIYRLGVPIPPEQQKIAECLSSLDGLIAAEGRMLEALKAHKKGLMQQLFPQPGQTQPRLRFPEFRDKGEWDMRPLGDICERIMDGTHFSPKTKVGPRPYLTSKNIRNGAMDLSTVTFISEEEHRDIYKRCPVRIHDVLLTKDGASTGNCTINTLDYEFSLLSSVAVIRGNSELLDQQFLYQTIASDRTQQLIAGSISGQAITRITLTKLGEYPIAYPSKEEQERIADCLSALDTRIAAQATKIDALKRHKRGLMQQLFPTPEEVDA